MLETLKKFVFSHPELLQALKVFFSSKYVANSTVYKWLVMRKVERYVRKSQEYRKTICVENTLSCNCRCVFCGHHTKAMSGTMTRELYEKIIDDCHKCGIAHIVLTNYGEPMLDKQFFQRIEYLRKYEMTYGFFTNASLLTPDKVDRLFEMGGLTFINFSVNGFSREVYEKTMVGLNRDVAYEHVLHFLKKKEELHAADLRVAVSSVRTDLNRKDFKEWFAFWKKQEGVNIILPVELFDRMAEEYDGQLGKLGPLTQKGNWLSPCRSLWNAMTVYYDGRVAPCCMDSDNRELIVGDATKQTIGEILDGETASNLRRCHLAGKRSAHPICGRCYYNAMWLGQ